MKNVQISDSQLVSAYIKGDENSFGTLLQRHNKRVYTIIYMIVKSSCIAEDILQDVCIKAITTIKSGKYNEEGKFLPWISRIAHNMAIDHFRKAKRYPTTVMEDNTAVFNSLEFTEDSFETIQIKNETHALVKRLIDELPESQKEVLMMRHYMEMSFQEIAESTGVSINTALGRMRYALINLRKQMNLSNVPHEHRRH